MDQSRWTAAENWAWDQIKKGKPADFTKKLGRPKKGPKGGLGAERTIRGAFLREILFEAALRSAISDNGIQIKGARVSGHIDLSNGKFDRCLVLVSCQFDGRIDLSSFACGEQISFIRCTLAAKGPNAFNANALTAKHFQLNRSKVAGKVDLTVARIAGNLELQSSFDSEVDLGSCSCKLLFCGPIRAPRLQAGGIKCEGDLIIGRAKIGTLFLAGTSLGALRVSGTQLEILVCDDLHANSVEIENSSAAQNVLFNQVRISGNVSFNSTRFGAQLRMHAAEANEITLIDCPIADSLFLEEVKTRGDLYVANSAQRSVRIGGNVSLDRAQIKGTLCFRKLDCIGTNSVANAMVGGNLKVSGRYRQVISFVETRIAGNALFESCVMDGPVFLGNAHVQGSLIATGTTEAKAHFVGGISLEEARVDGKCQFLGVECPGGLHAMQMQVGQGIGLLNYGESLGRFGVVNLNEVCGGGNLHLCASDFTGTVQFIGCKIAGDLLLAAPGQGSTKFSKRVSGRAAVIGGFLFSGDASFEAEIDLKLVQAGKLEFVGKFKGTLDLSGANIAQDVLITGAFNEHVLVERASIGGDLLIGGARIQGGLNAVRLNCAGNFLLAGARINLGVVFHFAAIKGDLNFADVSAPASRFRDPVAGSMARIGGNLIATKGVFRKGLSLAQIRVGGRAVLAHSVFRAPLDLSAARFDDDLILSTPAQDVGSSRFAQGIVAPLLSVGGSLSVAEARCGLALAQEGQPALAIDMRSAKARIAVFGGTFAGPINLTRSQIDEDLQMDGKFKSIILDSVLAKGSALINANVQGDMNFIGCKVGRLVVTGRCAGDLDLTKSRITNEFQLSADCAGTLKLTQTRIGSDLHIAASEQNPLAFSGQIEALATEIEGVAVVDLHCEKSVKFFQLKVAGNCKFSGKFRGGLDLDQSKLGIDLILHTAEIGECSLKRTAVGGTLILGTSADLHARWTADAKLDLAHAQCGALHDWSASQANADGSWDSSWPEKGRLNLDGFAYQRIVENDDQPRDIAWYRNWLSRDEPYSPAYYEELARYFKRIARGDLAEGILFESRSRERQTAWQGGRRSFAAGFWLLQLTTGFGIGSRLFFRPLLWTVGMTIIGAMILAMCEPATVAKGDFAWAWTWPSRFVFSFDQLLPVVELDGAFNKIPLVSSPATYWFWLHRLVGWALGLFIVAGIGGLTQKSR